MLDLNQIVHDLTMLHLEKTYDFKDNITKDEAQLAMQYEEEFENIQNQLRNFNLLIRP